MWLLFCSAEHSTSTWQGVGVSVRSAVLFVGGLIAGYVISGFLLGPGVLAVLAGIALGLALACGRRARSEGPQLSAEQE